MYTSRFRPPEAQSLNRKYDCEQHESEECYYARSKEHFKSDGHNKQREKR